ncbi:MAG: glutathione S-transferase [Kofleriaceae bacterium]|nr:glutathione S-transferase [Kofleriaceae bacterium]
MAPAPPLNSIDRRHLMLRLYIGNKNYSSWSLRPWVLMQELAIPFEEHLVPFESGAVDGTPAFRRFSPTGRVPCLVDGERTVWDSLAIAEYLAESYPSVWPSDRGARAWARCVAAEMHSGFQTIRTVCTMNCGLRVKVAEWSSAHLREWKRVDDLWCEGLARHGGPFLAGATFSAADAFFAPVAFRVQSYAPALSTEASAYAARLLARAPMRAWYAAALTEPWRDEPHEAEARATGLVLEDLRTSAG